MKGFRGNFRYTSLTFNAKFQKGFPPNFAFFCSLKVISVSYVFTVNFENFDRYFILSIKLVYVSSAGPYKTIVLVTNAQ